MNKSVSKKKNEQAGSTPPSKDADSAVVEEIKAIATSVFSGPLPPPRMMEQYNLIDPTFANRILQIAEREQAHRHGMDKRMIEGQFRERRIG